MGTVGPVWIAIRDLIPICAVTTKSAYLSLSIEQLYNEVQRYNINAFVLTCYPNSNLYYCLSLNLPGYNLY